MTELVDPQLEAFFDSNPEILRPLNPDLLISTAKVPAWYDNSVVELAGAILAVRGLVALSLLRQGPPPPGAVQAVAGQAWAHHAPTWLKFTVPAVKQVYSAGRIRGLTDAEMEAMAADYAAGLGEYLDTTSAEALAEGFQAQLDDRWDASLAWHRTATGYGIDRPDMRSYLRAVLNQPKGQRDPVGTGAKMLVDRLLIARADRVAKAETWTASQTGLATSWLVRQQRGEISADARRRWRTRHGETVCTVCGPMDGQEVALDQPFTSAAGDLFAPGAHPGCMCSQELVETFSKSKRLPDGTTDPYDRRKDGRFARREERTRVVTHLADPIVLSPEAQAIVDQLHGIAPVEEAERVSPFSVDRKVASPFAKPGSPFARSESPFAQAKSPFGVDTRSPFAPASAFEQGPGEGAARPKRKRVIHHVFVPKKSAADDFHLGSDSYYLPVHEWARTYEYEEMQLVQPGDRFDFDETADLSAANEYHEGTLPDELRTLVEAAMDESTWHMDPGKVPKSLRQMFALPATRTGDPWRDIVEPPDDRIWDVDPHDIRDRWSEIQPVAKRVWDHAIEEPALYVDRLSRQELDHIYDVAGYDRAEDDSISRQRIVDACQEHGIVGDDSLAEAYADHITWGGRGIGTDADDLVLLVEDLPADIPPMTNDYGHGDVYQVFAFDHGFHPETGMRNEDKVADVEGQYTVHHVMYRSNLGELGDDSVPFLVGIREAAMWPADQKGNFLHGGPYRDPS